MESSRWSIIKLIVGTAILILAFLFILSFIPLSCAHEYEGMEVKNVETDGDITFEGLGENELHQCDGQLKTKDCEDKEQ